MNSINLYLVVLLAFWGELAPVFGQKRPEKPGQCPGEQPGMAGICVVNCEDDWSCPGAQKCCGSCPRDCAIPVRERSGRCPIPPQGTVTTCELRCVNDYECPWPKKCCKYGCKTDCFYPV
ncbi:peptide [Podarcis lilfordi]|uniref:Peptide n=1 Tax=Podarcis lilfordi TaxID=74358 RepID=A0AA35KJG7_9SAUR|nr:peptide [Podarcis lilfordi]